MMLARLRPGKSWTPSGTPLKKPKGTWLKFGPWMKKPWLSSAERRENKPVGRSVDRSASLCQQAARLRRRGDRVKRRDFITLLGGAAAWPLAARAQQPGKIPRIGVIDDSPRWKAFRHGLRDLGYLEGQNIAFDYAYGDGVPERLANAAAALVRRPVDVIARQALKS